MNAICNACINCVRKLHEDKFCEKLNGFVLYCSPGCTTFGIALASIESIARKRARHSELSEQYIALNAFEWEYVNIHYELFYDCNVLLDNIYKALYDSDMNDGQISAFFEEVATTAIENLKEKEVFLDPLFGTNILLGLQFTDPSDRGIDLMKRVSAAVNSERLHKEFCENCDCLLEQGKDFE